MKPLSWTLCVLASASPLAWAQAAAPVTVYRCPGNVYTSSAELQPKQAEQKGCKVLEGAPITIVQTSKPAPVRKAEGASRDGRSPESRVDPNTQRQRDTDARKLLEAELAREEERLAELQREFNNGEPERRGDERNAQKYIDRVADMRAAITRKQEDIAAIKRELSKLQ